ncbi:hypothetical protein Ccrd_013593 [Cynara cardunculus var. scolymus]|uniref:Pentatricopeptide repeat-containing protein n=1 Tax=Cynara cardunculus var. scolymus TaxID=59895 RepID=A0A103YFB9_CYNCS|nr:hypothetical protein Ccrd_013593 [Cynara cardunculus var. scolymus]
MYQKLVDGEDLPHLASVEAYGQVALYKEALVTFSTMNELGSNSTIGTFNSLIDVFAMGGLYKEYEQ